MAVSRINEAGLNVNQYGNRNVIINGAMKVSQRGTSSTGLGGASGYFTLDRYRVAMSGTAGRFTMSQAAVTDLPGFSNSMKCACTTADTSVAASELFILQQRIEGQDLQQFAKGTSSAKEFTVSFYVKGNAAATYVCELYDDDNARQVSKTFSVTTSWTRVEITYPADTTGAFDDDNNKSLLLQIWLHAGSNYTSGTLNTSWAAQVAANRVVGIDSFFDSTSRTVEFTGLQLEVGDTATDFEHRTFADELMRCARYYYKFPTPNSSSNYFGTQYGANNGFVFMDHPCEMRANPTFSFSSANGSSQDAVSYGSKSRYAVYIDNTSPYVSGPVSDAEL